MIRTTSYAVVLCLSVMLSVCAAAVVTSSCAPKTYHATVVADDAIAQSLFALQASEQKAYDAHAYDKPTHIKYATTILKALKSGRDLNEAVSKWTPGDQPSDLLRSAIASFNAMNTELRAVFPPDNKLVLAVSYVLQLLVPKG